MTRLQNILENYLRDQILSESKKLWAGVDIEYGETKLDHSMRLYDFGMRIGITDIRDLTKFFIGKYGYSASTLSTARKELLKKYHKHLKILGHLKPNGEKLNADK